MEAYNTKAMREALVGLAQAVREFMATKGANFYPDVAIALEAANAALSAPLRQCDVGTVGEQTTRYRRFCSAHKYLGSDFSYMCKGFGKGRCPFFNSHTKSQCEFAWAQMPYEAEEGGAE